MQPNTNPAQPAHVNPIPGQTNPTPAQQTNQGQPGQNTYGQYGQPGQPGQLNQLGQGQTPSNQQPYGQTPNQGQVPNQYGQTQPAQVQPVQGQFGQPGQPSQGQFGQPGQSNQGQYGQTTQTGQYGQPGQLGQQNQGQFGQPGQQGQFAQQNQLNNQFAQDPYSYRTMNFTGYHPQQYGITQNQINTHAQTLFSKYDRDRSGSLTPNELYPLMGEFFMVNNLQPMSPQDLRYLLYIFDEDGSGKIEYREFAMMLESLGGLHVYNRENVSHHRQHQGHNQRY